MAGRGKELAELMVELVAAGAQVFVNGGEHFHPATVEFLLSGSVSLRLARAGRH